MFITWYVLGRFLGGCLTNFMMFQFRLKRHWYFNIEVHFAIFNMSIVCQNTFGWCDIQHENVEWPIETWCFKRLINLNSHNHQYSMKYIYLKGLFVNPPTIAIRMLRSITTYVHCDQISLIKHAMKNTIFHYSNNRGWSKYLLIQGCLLKLFLIFILSTISHPYIYIYIG